MGECNSDISPCCYKYNSVPGYIVCPVCGQPLSHKKENLYRLYKYSGGRLIDIQVVLGSLDSIIATLAFDNYEYTLEIIDAKDMFSLVPKVEPTKDTYMLTLKTNTSHSLRDSIAHINDNLPDFRVASTDVDAVKLRRVICE